MNFCSMTPATGARMAVSRRCLRDTSRAACACSSWACASAAWAWVSRWATCAVFKSLSVMPPDLIRFLARSSSAALCSAVTRTRSSDACATWTAVSAWRTASRKFSSSTQATASPSSTESPSCFGNFTIFPMISALTTTWDLETRLPVTATVAEKGSDWTWTTFTESAGASPGTTAPACLFRQPAASKTATASMAAATLLLFLIPITPMGSSPPSTKGSHGRSSRRASRAISLSWPVKGLSARPRCPAWSRRRTCSYSASC